MAEIKMVSPLGSFAQAFADLTVETQGAFAVVERRFTTQITLRSAPGSAAYEAAAAALGTELPLTPNTVVARNGIDVLWLGPDEWLIVTEEPGELERQLNSALDGLWGSVVDVSAQRTIVDLEGPQVRSVLARGCALDLHPSVFASGQCAQTLLGQAPVILLVSGAGGESMRIIVRASFAQYVAEWLLDASVEERSAADPEHPLAIPVRC